MQHLMQVVERVDKPQDPIGVVDSADDIQKVYEEWNNYTQNIKKDEMEEEIITDSQ